MRCSMISATQCWVWPTCSTRSVMVHSAVVGTATSGPAAAAASARRRVYSTIARRACSAFSSVTGLSIPQVRCAASDSACPSNSSVTSGPACNEMIGHNSGGRGGCTVTIDDGLVNREVMELRATPTEVLGFVMTPERILDYYPDPIEG